MPTQKDTAKPWFVTGAFPTQAQFYSLFDSIWFKDEKLAITDVEGLQVILNNLNAAIAAVSNARPERLVLNNNGSFLMLAEYKLVAICFINDTVSEQTISLSIIDDPITVPAGGKYDLAVGETFIAETTVTVTGVTGKLVLLIDRK